MESFIIHGGKKLSGEVVVSGSKNATLPILAATLLTDKLCVIRNVPDIQDVRTMLELLESLGAEIRFKNNVVTIQTKTIKNYRLKAHLACSLRASLLLWGPLLARVGKVTSAYPGGCVLGKRSIGTHVHALKAFGARFSQSRGMVSFRAKKLLGKKFTLKEFSVTGTENAVMAAVSALGKTKIRLAAAEPHVVDLCLFLKKMGAKISGIGTHVITVHGVKKLKGVTYRVVPDYLEVGIFTLAAVLTGGSITVKNLIPEDLEIFWNLLREVGAQFTVYQNSVVIRPAKKLVACERLQTAIHPGFPTDLQAPFVVLLTQCKGDSLVHETLFEDRFRYVPELKKMGAGFTILNPHQIIVSGPRLLKGAVVNSCDIRAGAAVVLAALAARGKTTIKNISYIDRGYERLEEKLLALGAAIERVH